MLQTNGSGVLSFSSSGGKFESALLHIRDEKTAGTSGGTFTSGDWRTRTLNTSVTNEISGASLSSNQITLPTGTYFAIGFAPAHKCDGHKTRLRNITDSSDTLIGSAEFQTSATAVQTSSIITGRFTIASSKVFEFQHRCDNTNATYGFGVDIGYSVVEIYANIMIWKVA